MDYLSDAPSKIYLKLWSTAPIIGKAAQLVGLKIPARNQRSKYQNQIVAVFTSHQNGYKPVFFKVGLTKK